MPAARDAATNSAHRSPRSRAQLLALGLALALVPVQTRAASRPGDDDQALPCRPTVACTAELARPGTLELELGYYFAQATAQQHSTPFLVKLTLASWAQLQIGSNGLVFTPGAQPSRYFGVLVTTLKFQLLKQQKRAPSLGWSVSAGTPVDQTPGTPRAYDLSWTGYLSKDLGRFHLDFNLGVILWQIDAATRPQPWASLATSVSLPRRFGLVAEVYYFAPAQPNAAQDGGVRLVVSYAPRPWLVLDLGADIGWFPAQRAASAFAGISAIPVRLW